MDKLAIINNGVIVLPKGKLAVDNLDFIVSSTDDKLAVLDFTSVEKNIIATVIEFMTSYSPYPECTNLVATKNFAELIIAGYGHWILADVANFLKWFIQNQHLEALHIMGNKITFLKLAQVLPIYEEMRIDVIRSKKAATAIIEAERKGGLTVLGKSVLDEIRKRVKPKYERHVLTPEEEAELKANTTLFQEFDELWAKQQTTHGHTKYVTVNNVIYYSVDWESERKFGKLKDYARIQK